MPGDVEDEVPRLILPAADGVLRRAGLWDALVGRNRAAVLASVADGCPATQGRS